MLRKIEIEIPEGKRAEWNNGVLTFVDDPKDIRDRIKTFDDACSELGENHQYVRAYREWMRISYAECEDITAYMKLRIITTALNEGWEPQFVEGEKRWYAWYDLLTEDDYNDMTDEEKCRVVGRAYSSAHAFGGLVYSYTSYVSTVSFTGVGSQLAFKSGELAEYAAKQFIDIYAEYCFKS
jgi:hypothetical protein